MFQMQSSGVDGNVDAVIVSADDIESLTSVQQPSAGNGDDQNSVSLQNLPNVFSDVPLMYILQQQQQQAAGGVAVDGGASMMMMSPAALQSLLVSQMVAAVNSGMTCASSMAQSVTGPETRFTLLTFNVDTVASDVTVDFCTFRPDISLKYKTIVKKPVSQTFLHYIVKCQHK